jgi:hypothetical protein
LLAELYTGEVDPEDSNKKDEWYNSHVYDMAILKLLKGGYKWLI